MKDHIHTWLNGLACGIIGVLIVLVIYPKHITIESSSDSEWVRSEKDYGDTTITEVRIMKHEGKIDTVYPTTIYKRIEL